MVKHMHIRNKPTRFAKTSGRLRRRKQPGIALLVCLFVLSIVSVWTVDMLESASVYQSALRNTIEYEQALYQANAGVHHVLAQLEANVSLAWNGDRRQLPGEWFVFNDRRQRCGCGHCRCHIHRRRGRNNASIIGHNLGELRVLR